MVLVKLLATTLVAMSAAHAATPPPAEAYGRLPAISSVALSPDGKRVVVSVGYEYRAAEPDRELTALNVIELDTGKIEARLAPPPKNNLRGVGWADDQRSYYFISSSGHARDAMPPGMPITIRGPRVEWFRTGVHSLATGKSTLLMEDSGTRGNSALTNLQAPIDGDPGFGRMIAWGGLGVMNAVPKLSVWRVNLDNGNATAVENGSMKTRGFLLDEKGKTIARVDIDDDKNRWRLFNYEDGKDRMVLEQVSEMGQPLLMYGLFDDGRIAAVDPHKEGQRDTLLAIDRKTGKSTPVEGLPTSQGSDVSPIMDPWRRRVVGVRWTEDLPKQHFLDPQLAGIAASVEPLFADGFAVLMSWSRDRARALLFGEHADDAGAYYVYDVATKKLRLIGKSYPQLTAPEHLGDRRSIKYPARDGKAIPAYLTLPAGVEPKNLPLVLLVHGGPHARDDFTFDWWASFLASRGYVVLQPNYRGSTGYGYEWFDAGRKGWGDGVMQHDVEDGADALVKSGIVDPKRVCIMGGSYGGYAALAGATITPDRYACAVSVNGVADLAQMLTDAQRGGKKTAIAEWWGSSMGGDDMDHVRRISPARQADAVKIPILLIHGVEDTVVPVEQSREMNAKLVRAKKDVRYVEIKGDDHWLSSASSRTQVLQEIETFLAKRLASNP
jgi:dipeptidyl aminopeptidase/acylaminoacyl peptidase